MQNAPRDHSAILATFIKIPFVFKTFVLSISERPLETGFTVCCLDKIISTDICCNVHYLRLTLNTSAKYASENDVWLSHMLPIFADITD